MHSLPPCLGCCVALWFRQFQLWLLLFICLVEGPWSYLPESLELRGAGSGYIICSLGTSESWIKGIPDPVASGLPNPASKKKDHLLSSSKAMGRGLPKRRPQEQKQKEDTGQKSMPIVQWSGLTLTACTYHTILQDCSALYLCLIYMKN